jgi:hypothetical protein
MARDILAGMPDEKKSTNFFESHCVGTLRSKNRTVEIVFQLTCSREGDLILTIEDVPFSNENLWLRDAFDEPSEMPISLDAKDNKNRIVTSSTIYFTSVGTRSKDDDSWLMLQAMAVWLEVAEPDFSSSAAADGVTAAYFPVGIQGFGTLSVGTRAGNLKLLAQSEVKISRRRAVANQSRSGSK